MGGDHWVKTTGVYVILILAVLRFLVYPLHSAVKDRKALLVSRQEAYALKTRLLEQAKHARDEENVRNTEKIRSGLYPKETRISDIQADVLAFLSQRSEGKGLTVSGFEMPDVVVGKGVSEIPVILKLAGGSKAFVELLKGIRENNKTLVVKAMEISAGSQNTTFLMTVSAFRTEL